MCPMLTFDQAAVADHVTTGSENPTSRAAPPAFPSTASNPTDDGWLVRIVSSRSATVGRSSVSMRRCGGTRRWRSTHSSRWMTASATRPGLTSRWFVSRVTTIRTRAYRSRAIGRPAHRVSMRCDEAMGTPIERRSATAGGTSSPGHNHTSSPRPTPPPWWPARGAGRHRRGLPGGASLRAWFAHFVARPGRTPPMIAPAQVSAFPVSPASTAPPEPPPRRTPCRAPRAPTAPRLLRPLRPAPPARA